MLFKPESIEQILAGRKTMTRRLVKENEIFEVGEIKNPSIGIDNKGFYLDGNMIGKSVIQYTKGKKKETMDYSPARVKWQVGRKYAVCVEGKQVWYCKNCKETGLKSRFCAHGFSVNSHEGSPLAIEIIGIRKEKLLDITEEDAKREGFKNKVEFIRKFMEIYLKKLPFEYFIEPQVLSKFRTKQNDYEAKLAWIENLNYNPDVWVISFKVVE